jgi:uncharacterized protein
MATLPGWPSSAAAYTPDVSRAVYKLLAERAALVLQRGHAVIVDAVFFADISDRRAIENVAAAAGVPFDGVWLDAPASVLVGRTARRRADASDADAGVVAAQVRYATGPIRWQRVDASGRIDRVLAGARETLVPVTARVLSGSGGGR